LRATIDRHHGEVRTQEVCKKGKVQSEAESGAQNRASQRAKHHEHELQSAQDRVAESIERTWRTRNIVKRQSKHQGMCTRV